jgi:molecular chaperone HtpG
MDDCEELMPEYFRFIKGVVDAPDLNLNISREILQQDRLVANIRKNLVKKLLELLEGMEGETYEKFYAEFGPILKIGIHTDADNRNRIAALARYKTTKSDGKWVSLKDYVANMKSDQKEIYYITGENLTALMNSPHLERLKEKDFEVLLMVDPIDEWVVQALNEFDGKPFKSAEKGDLETEAPDKTKEEAFNALFGCIKANLEDKVKEVKASTHLKDSLSCLSGNPYDMSIFMERMLKATGQKPQEVKRVLEINMDHPVMTKIKAIYDADRNDPLLQEYSHLLYDMALIGEGGKIDNPSRFHRLIGGLMDASLKA